MKFSVLFLFGNKSLNTDPLVQLKSFVFLILGVNSFKRFLYLKEYFCSNHGFFSALLR